MKHEVKFKAKMPVCHCAGLELLGKDCDGYDYNCHQYCCEDYFESVCDHCIYDKEIFQVIQTNSVVFERQFPETYDEEQTLKIGRKDYSDCNIEYLEIDGTVLIDKAKKE